MCRLAVYEIFILEKKLFVAILGMVKIENGIWERMVAIRKKIMSDLIPKKNEAKEVGGGGRG